MDAEVECIASHFAVCGVTPGALEPIDGRAAGSLDVLVDVCVVLPGKGEVVPPGFTLITQTPNGQRASLNHGDMLGAQIFLACRYMRLDDPVHLSVTQLSVERHCPN